MTRHPGFPSRLLALAAIALTAANARADGAFPDEFSIHFPASAPHRMLIGANFGLLVSEDDGLSWRYACEPWVVSGSNAALAFANVSFYQVTVDGAFLADSIDLTRSADVGCTWPVSTGSITGTTIADIFADPDDATLVLAIVARTNGSSVVVSRDGGRTFDAAHLYDTPDLLTGIESKAGLFYATSVSTTGGPPKFIASTNAGATWTETILQLPAGTEPRILAVDPADHQKVYLRLVGSNADAVAITPDGGKTFSTVLSIAGQFSSFLQAGDGALYAGTRSGQLYVQPAGASAFTQRSAPHLRCLGQRPGSTRIYACTDMVVDGYSLASSDDGAATFKPVMSFTQLLGPLTCEPVQTNCAAHWSRIQSVLGINQADGGQAAPDGGAASSHSGGSHCASAGVDGCCIWVFLALALRRARRLRDGGALRPDRASTRS